MTVDAMIDATIGKEGRYSDHPSDPGGKTMWGITERVARANGYTGDMRSLPRDTAKQIYRMEYYVRPGFARIGDVSLSVAEELFDTGVNMGWKVPATWFQEWLNAFNQQQRDYADIVVDGMIGPTTVRTFQAFRTKRGALLADMVMVRALNCSQGARYLQLAQGRQSNEDFLFGWIANRVAS